MHKPVFIELNYFSHTGCRDPLEVINMHRIPNAFTEHLVSEATVILVKHMDFEGELNMGKRVFRFFRKQNHFFSIPFKTHRYIKKQKPAAVILSGFIFPLQVVALRLTLGPKPVVIIQHQGEAPFRGIKKMVQQLAARCANGFFFTSTGNALPWVEARIIRDKKKVFEMLPASTHFRRRDKQDALRRTGISGEHIFLWVGRLDENKDPLTVLTAFAEFTASVSSAKLYMIYQDEKLLNAVNSFINLHPQLQQTVILVGRMPHEELVFWYSAADFYVTGSHREGGSFALVEAMACGCIPVVTDLPSAMKVIEQGWYGFYFSPGNKEALLTVLHKAIAVNKQEWQTAVIGHFNKQLTDKFIAENIWKALHSLMIK